MPESGKLAYLSRSAGLEAFKCYVRTTMPKLTRPCREHEFGPMCELAGRTGSSWPAVPAAKPQAA